MALHDLLDAANPAATLSDDHRSCTVREFGVETQAWAGLLTDRGAVRGDRVAFLLPNCVTLAAALLGALRAGLVPVPLHPGTPLGQLDDIMRDCRPALLVVDASRPDGAPAGDPPVRFLPADPAFALGPPAATAEPAPAVEPDDIALIMYTSGSTAAPRGVVCPHRQAEFAVRAIADRLGYRPGDVVFSCLPMSFDYGLYQLFLALHGGSDLVLAPSGVGPLLLARAHRAGATVVPVVPGLARRLCLLAGRPNARRPPVRLFTNTGDALTPEDCVSLRRGFPGAGVVRMFGLTECKRVSISEPDEDLDAPDAVGLPLPGTALEVRDEDGRPCRPGETGELVVHGPHVMVGYWGRPEETRRRFRTTPEGTALYSGDFGWIDEAGRFCFSHRADDTYKVGSVRVGAAEIESAAMRIDGTTAVCVVRRSGHPDPVVFVVSDRPRADILRALARELGAHKSPGQVVVVDELPENRNGKVDRARLRELAAEVG
ncbi:AMP-binding protein [Streptacidiphilus sp. PB12-B1b]|uniref:class I adenylate-forming enzyme family protein n=1 Tax=Streptacidiphilus sp. PB12-B1b TaxID=2705012 RepID=UPI0015FC1872|nr:AMP-binding protein [Streptacidiphilus sp. PB12-B1b]QMU78269.1 AMP-binding protein [Streptacidiphilus sp. PB12-B1b]